MTVPIFNGIPNNHIKNPANNKGTVLGINEINESDNDFVNRKIQNVEVKTANAIPTNRK